MLLSLLTDLGTCRHTGVGDVVTLPVRESFFYILKGQFCQTSQFTPLAAHHHDGGGSGDIFSKPQNLSGVSQKSR